MLIQVIRKIFTGESTIGDMLIDGKFKCYTLEDMVREVKGVPVEKWKVKGVTAIPEGKYKVVVDFSNRFQKLMPHILDVPGFSGVRIHCGNKSTDVEGCVALGMDKLDNAVGRSRVAYDLVYAAIRHAICEKEEIEIEVKHA